MKIIMQTANGTEKNQTTLRKSHWKLSSGQYIISKAINTFPLSENNVLLSLHYRFFSFLFSYFHSSWLSIPQSFRESCYSCQNTYHHINLSRFQEFCFCFVHYLIFVFSGKSLWLCSHIWILLYSPLYFSFIKSTKEFLFLIFPSSFQCCHQKNWKSEIIYVRLFQRAIQPP